MGSGAGKTRRTRASSSPFWEKSKRKAVPAFHEDRWEAFVNDGKLSNISLWKYYLGNKSEWVKRYSYENLATELFADAVAVGAITLPDPYEANDFQFASSVSTNEMVLRLKKKVMPADVRLPALTYFFRRDNTLGEAVGTVGALES